MSHDDLRHAFGLANGLGQYGAIVMHRIGTYVSAADQGTFVRRDKYLNIPGPGGTALQGDPVVSIEIDQEMKEAVRQLLGDPEDAPIPF